MAIAGDEFGRVAGVVDEDVHRGDHDVDGVTVGGDVELAGWGEELHQVEAGEVAGGVVEEHVLRAGIAGVDAAGVLAGVPLVDDGVVLHAGVAALPGGFGDLGHDVASLVGGVGRAVLDGLGGEIAIAFYGAHEFVGDADGVVGVLEEDAGVGLTVRTGAVVAGLDEGPRLGFLLALALDEVDDVRVLDVEDDHLGGATGFATGLDDAGKGVKAAHEAEGAAGGAAAGEQFLRSANGGEICAGAGAPLEEHAFSFGEGEDGVERVLNGVDEAGRALRLAVAGDGELDGAGVLIPVPVLGVGVGLEAIAADVEPDGRVEGNFLMDEQVDELVVEDGCVFGRGEVAVLHAPVADCFSDTGDEGADAGFALGGADLAVEIFAGDDVDGGHGPVDRGLDVFLFEDDVAFEVLDDGVAALPLHFRVR